MSYLRTPEESPLFDELASSLGYVPNYARAFALAPDAYRAWQALAAAIKGGMDERCYELVTVVTALRLRSRYCAVAHAAILRDKFYDEDTLRAIVADPRSTGLDPGDLAAMDFEGKIAADPTAATGADVRALRDAGLSEQDIVQVVLTATVRRFFAGLLDAVGASPDPVYDSLADAVPR